MRGRGGGRGGDVAEKTPTASTSHMTLAKLLFVCNDSSSGIVRVARGNHNVCIIYLRFAFKGFKLLFNLVFPS